jgi:hypothetical protein
MPNLTFALPTANHQLLVKRIIYFNRRMSLTRFITDPNHHELREQFKKSFPRPAFVLNDPLLAPPLTNNYAIVGAAFDYLLRFWMEHHYGTKIIKKDRWVAEASFNYLLKEKPLTDTTTLMIGFKRSVPIDRNLFMKTLTKEFRASKANYEQYVNTGMHSDKIIRSALFLARLDVFYRSGMIDPNIGNESIDDINDLKALLKLLDKKHFHVKKYCFVNPNFEGSGLVGGADADLIIDDTLVEIKVTKDLSLKRVHLNQLIGYYVLSLIGDRDKKLISPPLKYIGIYFARHGVLWKIPISSLASPKDVDKFKDFFVNFTNKQIWDKVKIPDHITKITTKKGKTKGKNAQR